MVAPRTRLVGAVGIHSAYPDCWPKRCFPSVGTWLNFPGCAEPGIYQRAPLASILNYSLTFSFVIKGHSAITHQQVESIERSVPAIEHITTTRGYEIILEWTTSGNDHPFEVLLTVEIAWVFRCGPYLGIV